MRRLIVIALILSVMTTVSGCVRVFAETMPQVTIHNRTDQDIVVQMQAHSGVVQVDSIPAGQTSLTRLSVGQDDCGAGAFVGVAADGRRTAPRERLCNNDEWIITASDLDAAVRPS